MNVIIIGTGFVGATHAAVLASYGHSITAYDINEGRIKDLSSKDPAKIDSCIYEPGLAQLIQKHQITFTTKLEQLPLETTDIIFLCLPTPASELELPDDKKHLFIAAKQLSQHLTKRNNGKQDKHILLVNKSTVPIGTADKLRQHLHDWGVQNYTVASNPEFLVEGKAVQGSQHPDRIVIGVETQEDEQTLKQLYAVHQDKIITVKPKDAEAIKLIANFELFSTIVRTFQVAGRLCEVEHGLNFENIIKGVTTDPRIPKWGHHTSLYAGGSCFEKDAHNLQHTLSKHNIKSEFVKSIIEGNDHQLENFYKRGKAFGFNGKTVALLGTAFKQDTNDVRMSPAIQLTNWLLSDGVKQINAYDPQAGQNYKTQFPDQRVKLCNTLEEALANSEIVMICTDWPEFKNIKMTNSVKLLMDGRRSLAGQYEEIARKGIIVVAVGSPTINRL
ncbi:UDP-glucose/GDP-mannose dehydrogenase family protein [Candidatus Woesearchaeota archaeon]|nr:UDP-glucose/GDP-mannose dehydrogenase family protein [Candidatus Woesearchaeota archaeon]